AGGFVFYKMDRAGLLEGLPEDVDISRSEPYAGDQKTSVGRGHDNERRSLRVESCEVLVVWLRPHEQAHVVILDLYEPYTAWCSREGLRAKRCSVRGTSRRVLREGWVRTVIY